MSTGAARYLVVTLLSRRSKDHPEVLIIQPACEQLFGRAADLASVPELTLVTGLSEALARMEAEIIHRGRLLEIAYTADFTAFRTGESRRAAAHHPSAHQPTRHPPHRPGRSRPGPWPIARHHRHHPRSMARHLHRRHRRHRDLHRRQRPPPPHRHPHVRTHPTGSSGNPRHPRCRPRKPRTGTGPPCRRPPRPQPEPTNQPPTGARRVRLKILGSVILEVDGTPIPTGQGFRRKGLELLLYLTLHLDGASVGPQFEPIRSSAGDGSTVPT